MALGTGGGRGDVRKQDERDRVDADPGEGLRLQGTGEDGVDQPDGGDGDRTHECDRDGRPAFGRERRTRDHKVETYQEGAACPTGQRHQQAQVDDGADAFERSAAAAEHSWGHQVHEQDQQQHAHREQGEDGRLVGRPGLGEGHHHGHRREEQEGHHAGDLAGAGGRDEGVDATGSAGDRYQVLVVCCHGVGLGVVSVGVRRVRRSLARRGPRRERRRVGYRHSHSRDDDEPDDEQDDLDCGHALPQCR